MPKSPASLSTPAVLALGGSLFSAALFIAGSQAGCAGGVGCPYGPATTWLEYCSIFVPLAAVAHLISCVAVAADRSKGRRLWYPRASAAALSLAIVALLTSATQWSIARAQFAPALALRTEYSMVLLGQATWVSVLAYLLGDAVPHERTRHILPLREKRKVRDRSWKRFGSV